MRYEYFTISIGTASCGQQPASHLHVFLSRLARKLWMLLFLKWFMCCGKENSFADVKDTYYLTCINTSPSYVLFFGKELFHSRKFTGEVVTRNYIIEIISCRSYRAKQNNNNSSSSSSSSSNNNNNPAGTRGTYNAGTLHYLTCTHKQSSNESRTVSHSLWKSFVWRISIKTNNLHALFIYMFSWI